MQGLKWKGRSEFGEDLKGRRWQSGGRERYRERERGYKRRKEEDNRERDVLFRGFFTYPSGNYGDDDYNTNVNVMIMEAMTTIMILMMMTVVLVKG